MAKHALVSLMDRRTLQVVESEEEIFEVAGDLLWVECGDEVDVEYDYIDGVFVKRPKIMTNYTTARKVGYGDVGQQLGMIYDSIANGDEDAMAKWVERQTKVKILFPKGDENQEAVQAAQEEVSKRLTEFKNYIESNNLPYSDPDMVIQVADDYISGKWINPVSGPYKA